MKLTLTQNKKQKTHTQQWRYAAAPVKTVWLCRRTSCWLPPRSSVSAPHSPQHLYALKCGKGSAIILSLFHPLSQSLSQSLSLSLSASLSLSLLQSLSLLFIFLIFLFPQSLSAPVPLSLHFSFFVLFFFPHFLFLTLSISHFLTIFHSYSVTLTPSLFLPLSHSLSHSLSQLSHTCSGTVFKLNLQIGQSKSTWPAHRLSVKP